LTNDRHTLALGDVEALAHGLTRLINLDLRDILGAAARREAVTRYAWREHTRRTIERLQEVVAESARDLRPAHA